MKEAPNKKMPPKMSGGASTPTKMPNDEILSTLLRINNFDSISGLKDESLDIDLSACVTINSDLASMMNGNSLSSTDFWRMLDESAQNTQFEITAVNDIRGSPEKIGTSSTPSSPSNNNAISNGNVNASGNGNGNSNGIVGIDNISNFSNADIKQEQSSFFGGIFLKPDPPVTPSSPITKLSRSLPAEQLQQKFKISPSLSINKLSKVNINVKQNGTHQEDIGCNDIGNVTGSSNSNQNSDLVANGSDKKTIPQQNLMKFFLNNLNDVTPTTETKNLNDKYKCTECDSSFEQEIDLKNHLKTHKSTESRKDAWKKCPDCGKCLKLGSIWMHRKIHSDNKKFACEICGQKFVQKINLTHHSRIHTAEKPYECPECQKRFQERSHLQRHQKYHAQTRSYRCDKCGKMYKTERCLKVHNLVHLEQRPFACNVCDKSFISNSKLKQHSNIHTGERPFKCNYCPRDFTNFPNWLKHTRRRHKVDHKTGEHLENIPSYCSKKSSKTAKPKKTTPPTVAEGVATEKVSPTEVATAPTSTALLGTKSVESTPKTQVKRKKKTPSSDTQAPLSVKIEQPQATNAIPEAKVIPQPQPQPPVNNVQANDSNNKPTKPKRERKQSTPKQVQKPIMAPVIKEEIIEIEPTKTLENNFADLNSLSLTLAEDLIMEQALEMEAMYDAPVPVVDTDNAISSETAAVLQFKIKNEFHADGMKQEGGLVSMKAINGNICSSLESSPFSSPASIEMPQKSTSIPSSSSGICTDICTTASTFYMPSFSIDSQGTIVTNGSSSNGGLVQQILPNSDQLRPSHTVLPSAQALINHLYMPMNVPLVVTPTNQTLPSVDTLLFPAHSNNTNFMHGKNIGQATAQSQHNLS